MPRYLPSCAFVVTEEGKSYLRKVELAKVAARVAAKANIQTSNAKETET